MEDFCFDYFDPITIIELRIEVSNMEPNELKFCVDRDEDKTLYMSKSEAKVLAQHILTWVEKE